MTLYTEGTPAYGERLQSARVKFEQKYGKEKEKAGPSADKDATTASSSSAESKQTVIVTDEQKKTAEALKNEGSRTS